jgi:Zn ribbon nucleic-acid-binding protein
MSAIYNVDCPVCRAKEELQVDDDDWQVYYFCFNCGYCTPLLKKMNIRGNFYYVYDHRHDKKKFAKFVNITQGHDLCLIGELLFYPEELVFDEYAIYPSDRNGKLIWKLYSSDKTKGGKLLGIFKRFKDADTAGEKYFELNK